MVKKTAVEIPDLNIGTMEVSVEGMSPYLSHKFSEKARAMMEAKQQGQAADKKAPKDPEALWKGTRYEIPGKKETFGIPANHFKQAMVNACRYADGIPMTVARGAFFVRGVSTPEGQVIPIKGKSRKRTDMVRLATGVADVRYRAEFPDWKAKIVIEYNANSITPAIITNLLKLAGFHVGVGDWRPQRNGEFGRFSVTNGNGNGNGKK